MAASARDATRSTLSLATCARISSTSACLFSMSYGAGAPSPGTSKLFSGAPPSTKHECFSGAAMTRFTSAHGRRNRCFTGEATVRASSSIVIASRHVGDARYAAPAAMPSAPVMNGSIKKPAATATPPSAPPTPIEVQATPR